MRVVIQHYPKAQIMPGYIQLIGTFNVLIGDEMVSVPAGSRSNFGSIPWFVRWLVSPVDRDLMIAAIVHDYECGEFGPEIVEWREAAQHLRAIMKHMAGSDDGWWRRLKRHLVYRGVMLSGIISGRASV